MVQGSDGNIILMNAGKNAALAALTGSDVNLGLAFLEVSNGAQAVAEILG
jgi:predicted regulator of Ras-like GTPase activity (Roadblock/LC7/MglB family)